MIGLLGFLIAPAAEAQEAFPYVAQITADNTNLRAGQNKNFEVVGLLKKGEDVVVVGASYEWRKVKLPISAKAYLNASFVKDLGDGVSRVIGKHLNVRAAASTSASVLCQLKKGDLVRVLEKNKDWLKIEPPDPCYGWLTRDGVSFRSSAIPPARVVQAPVRNVYVKHRLASQPPALAPGMISATGMVEDLADKTVSEDIRHFLQTDTQTVYYLQGYRHVIDGFLNQRVKIEGRLQSFDELRTSASGLPLDFRSDKPVVLVTKINLVL